MSELSRFFGIIIRMFAGVGGPHHRPHFHAYYQDSVAVFSIEPVELMTGSLPVRQRRLVEAWAECINTNSIRTGPFSKKASDPCPLIR